jgi:hypothetical protein
MLLEQVKYSYEWAIAGLRDGQQRPARLGAVPACASDSHSHLFYFNFDGPRAKLGALGDPHPSHTVSQVRLNVVTLQLATQQEAAAISIVHPRSALKTS